MSRTLLLKLCVETGSRFVFVNSTRFYPSRLAQLLALRLQQHQMQGLNYVSWLNTLKDAEGHLQKSTVSLLKHLAVLHSCMPTLTVGQGLDEILPKEANPLPLPTSEVSWTFNLCSCYGDMIQQSIWSAKRGVQSSDMQNAKAGKT